MGEFSDVTVVKQANVYFDGGVTSRTIKFANGEVKTLGFMQVGDYEFNTDKKELMEILQGEVNVVMEGQDNIQNFKAGDTFEVKANSSFKISALKLTDYCCSFVD